MHNNKPNIAVTGPNEGGATAWFFTALSIRLAGGRPHRLTPERFDQNLNYDAFVIGGGSDIHPENRTEEPLPTAHRGIWLRVKEALLFPMELLSRFTKGDHDKARDEMEKTIIEYAIKHDIPILGICRGHQLLNAALGGTLFTSTLPLLEDEPRIRSPFPRKKVLYVKDDSLIKKIAGDDPIKVNAIHSQAVAKPAEDLEITAREEAGIAQVVEDKHSDKVLGVQWHPEYLVYLDIHRKIFRWLVKEAA